MDFDKALGQISTSEELEQAIMALSEAQKELYRSSGENVTEALALYLPLSLYQTVTKALEVKNDVIDKDEYLNGLLERFRAMREIVVTVSFKPRQRTIEKLTGWIKANIANDVYLSLKYDSTILAGSTITFEGRYCGLSMGEKLDDHFGRYEKDYIGVLTNDTKQHG